ncbi:MAG TPA: hypothetical protein VNG31_09930 [Candidatus Baltobacteraceae bacterium]|nr:hypothetical protein [Candidatus Baltobacteraceae bacterium]
MNWRSLLDVVFPAQCASCNALGSGWCAACGPHGLPPIRIALTDVAVVAYGSYEGALRTAVLALKDGRRDVAEALGERIAPLIARGSLLVPVPTTPARRRVRGFDGVTLVAASAARIAGAAVVVALEQRAGDAQRGRTRDQRLAASGRFACVDDRVAGCTVTLVDDVCTTGATLEDCVQAVRAAGGAVSGAVVVAATKGGPAWRPSEH